LWNCGARSYLRRGDCGKPVVAFLDWAGWTRGPVVADALKREGINARVTDGTAAIEDD